MKESNWLMPWQNISGLHYHSFAFDGIKSLPNNLSAYADWSGNPARVNTRPFLLPIDLKEKNHFSRIVINLDGFSKSKTLVRASATVWVSRLAFSCHEKSQKRTFLRNLLDDLLRAARNVNKNVNKVKGSSLSLDFRPLWVNKLLKSTTSNFCYCRYLPPSRPSSVPPFSPLLFFFLTRKNHQS